MKSSTGTFDLPSGASWRLELLGGFCLHDGGATRHTRLHSRQVVALLARLAMFPRRDHAREELIEALWPGVDLATGRQRLRNALSVLKTLMEPEGGAATPVIDADRTSLRLVPGAVVCDVTLFERSMATGDIRAAIDLYRGDLLPGHYSDWIQAERQRLAALHERCLTVDAPAATSRVRLSNGHREPIARPPAATVAAAGRATLGAPESGPDAEPLPAEPGAGARRAVHVVGLPNHLTRLFGAEAQVAGVCAALRTERLVTLLGPGGCGKSRLAIAVAHRLALAGADAPSAPGAGAPSPSRVDVPFASIVRVPLVEATDRRETLDAIARALRIELAEPSLEAIVARLEGPRTLLVLDNLEQLVGRGAELVGELVAALPRLHLLVTSRRSLGLDGACDRVLAPLELPSPDIDIAAAAANPAIALFLDRAIAARQSFRLASRNLAAIVGIVRALDGLPLAIELAAARSRAFAPAELLERLRDDMPRLRDDIARLQDDMPPLPGAMPPVVPAAPASSMLDLLARNGPRAAHDPRHATMERTIAWSWSLLDANERRLAGAMTVFRGGCRAAMLQAVLGEQSDAALGLDSLLQHNLVHTHAGAPPDAVDDDGVAPLRFRIYEPIRRFVAAQLGADAARHWRARHRGWAVGWLEAMPRTLPIDVIGAELPNLCAALGSAAADGAGRDAARLLVAFAGAPEVVTWPVEVLVGVAPVLDRCEDATLRSRAHTVLAMLFFFAGWRLEDAARHAEAALAVAPPGSGARGNALYPLAVLRWRVGRRPDEAMALITEARAFADDDPHLAARLDTLHGFVVYAEAEAAAPEALQRREEALAQAVHLHERSLALRRTLGNAHAVHAGDYNIAHIRLQQGRRDEALARFRAVVAATAAVGDINLQSRALDAVGECLSEMRRHDEAIEALRASVRLAWRNLHRQALFFNLWNLGLPLARTRQPERALTLAAFAAGFWRTTIGELKAVDLRELRRLRRLCAVQLSRPAFDAAWARGEALTLVDAVGVALGTTA